MHATSFTSANIFCERYCIPSLKESELKILDIGGGNVNGSYKEIFEKAGLKYYFAEFRNQEISSQKIEVSEGGIILCHDNEFDFVISGQMLEHCEDPIQSVSEACRVLKENGLFCLIAPSAGPDHKYPIDCYRFYPDSFKVFAKKTDLTLLNLHHSKTAPWHDISGTFRKDNKDKVTCKDLNRNHDQDYTITMSGGEIINPTGEQPSTAEIDKALNNVQENFSSIEENISKGDLKPDTPKYLAILKEVHQLIKPRKYIEIGVRQGKSLSLSNSIHAIGIDPAPIVERQLRKNETIFRSSSDRFFRDCDQKIIKNICRNFDLAFIDGMHLVEYALRDFINLEKRSHENSVIIIDDILPPSYEWTSRDRKTKNWCGDVWRLIDILIKEREDLSIHLVECSPSPIAIIKKLDNKNYHLEKNLNRIEKLIRTTNPSLDDYLNHKNRMESIFDSAANILKT